MRIRELSFPNPFFLAPLAGYTDAPFRRIAHEWGAGCAVTEMVSAEGLARNSGNTKELLRRFEGEDQLIVQIFGPSLDPVERCLDELMKHSPTMIDINCGCPVPKVVKTGAGSALMKNPEEIYRMVGFLTQHTDVPVSVKFRLGWDAVSINYLDFADAAASGGASMLTLHARTRSQMYSGKADWAHIKALKDHFNDKDIRIFASGDIFTGEDAVSVMAQTGCDGVMMARGAMGNPFIFKEACELLEGREWSPTLDERKETLLRHLDYMIDWYGETVACRDMRKHAVHYFKGKAGSSAFRGLVNTAASKGDYEKALEAL